MRSIPCNIHLAVVLPPLPPPGRRQRNVAPFIRMVHLYAWCIYTRGAFIRVVLVVLSLPNLEVLSLPNQLTCHWQVRTINKAHPRV